jgi:HAD superfamily hydrolase (TIGR01509 family)
MTAERGGGGRLVVFDLMGTLVRDPYRAAHEAATGRSLEELLAAGAREAYHDLECGRTTEEEYWATLRGRGVECDVARFHAVRRAGYHWLDGMRDLLLECAAAHRTVVGSNYPDWVHDVEADFFAAAGVEVFASYRLGVRKPDPAFLAALCERTGCGPAGLVLVDDKTRNTDAAAAFGARGVPFTGARAAREALVAHGVLTG